MKILLTLDLNQPHSPERGFAEELIKTLWDQLQVTQAQIETLIPPPVTLNYDEWAQAGEAQEDVQKYRTLAPSPLESYDLIISVNLSKAAQEFFTSLGKRCLILRSVPCDGYTRFLLLRANFSLPKEHLDKLPSLKHVFQQDYSPQKVAQSERGWWLANRFLINIANRSLTSKATTNSSILFVGTSLFQECNLQDGKIITLTSFHKELMNMLSSCPNFYYSARTPISAEEIRFMKNFATTIPSLTLAQLLSRDELTTVVSVDSGIAPIAEAFEKPF